ncbi:hypothetical protein Aoc01nite_77530 [Actinoplanes octamycinicus]|nr:hypothetical protein Aoc01nite_77530 [Actinoplanes octamycinicus]
MSWKFTSGGATTGDVRGPVPPPGWRLSHPVRGRIMGAVARESSHLACALITLLVLGIGALIAWFRD